MPDTIHPPVSPKTRQRAKALRQRLTPAEYKLWQVLRNRNLGGYKFRRQHPIGHYILDFYCHERGLVIEIDGDVHSLQLEYDLQRTHWLADQGLAVIRYQNQQVLEQLEEVCRDILAHLKNDA